ncbi:nitrate ABC transporter permease [Candidatus Uhrbacteria bacterium]|nr:nitrate ABC transporter permease [Candidatus Uhrbacteria bacterium]
MQLLRAAFSPNRTLSARVMFLFAIAWAVSGCLIWIASPFAVLPGPGAVLRAFGYLWMHQGMSRELWASFSLSVQAVAIAFGCSLLIAYATVLPIFRPFTAVVSKLRFLGLIGISFVFMLIVGGGRWLQVSLVAFGITVFLGTSLITIVQSIPSDRFDYARTLRMGEWRVVWEVVVRGTRDQALSALRESAAIGWVMITMVEGIVRSEGGIGVLLLNENKYSHFDRIFAIQISIFLVGIAQDYGLGLLRRWLCPYADLTTERRGA